MQRVHSWQMDLYKCMKEGLGPAIALVEAPFASIIDESKFQKF